MRFRDNPFLISHAAELFRRVGVLAHHALRENMVGEYTHHTRSSRRSD
jgi:hypothetical protein